MPNQPPSSGAPAPILVAVDGTNLLHRAYHAHANSERRSADGRPVWALWGFARLLAAATEQVTQLFRAPTGLVIAFDGPRDRCRRRAADADYKATRREPDPDLVAQLTAAPVWLRDCGFSVVVHDGYEADDSCASAAHTATEHGWRCIIVTSDRDALAHTSPAVRVLRPVNGGRWECYGTRDVAGRYQLPAVAGIYATYAALRGDPSDNLPGVAGVGEKTAAAMLTALHEHGHTIDDVADGNADAVAAIAPRAHTLLCAGIGNYRRNRVLMDATVDLDIDLDAAAAAVDAGHIAESCAYQGISDTEALLAAAAHQVTDLVGSDF